MPDFKWLDPAPKVEVSPEDLAKAPIIMLPEAKSRLFVPKGRCNDDVLPEQHKAMECPCPNPRSSQQTNPAVKNRKSRREAVADVWDPGFACIATAVRLTEHRQDGAMSPNLIRLSELRPGMFGEISPVPAQAKSIKSGDGLRVKSAPGVGGLALGSRFCWPAPGRPRWGEASRWPPRFKIPPGNLTLAAPVSG